MTKNHKSNKKVDLKYLKDSPKLSSADFLIKYSRR